MALRFDTGSAPQTVDDLLSLAEAILQADAEDESDWLEWKRTLDLSDKQYQFELSKHILGFANRPPQNASLHCNGFAYMFIGIEPQSVTGVEKLDPAQLDDAINNYVGSDGPVWKHHYLRVHDEDILSIIVYPPKSGDPLHTLKKAYNNFESGAIFVRKPGKTTRADPGDVINLQERLLGTRLDLAITLSTTEPIPWFYDTDIRDSIDAIALKQSDSMLERAKNTLLATGRSSPTSKLPMAFQQSLLSPDKRTFEEYQVQVNYWQDRWVEQAHISWMLRYLEGGHGLYSLRLKNLTDRNFGNVEVQLVIRGAMVFTDLDEFKSALPTPPREFGEPKPLLVPTSHLDYSAILSQLNQNFSQQSIYAENGDGVAHVRWDAGDIRPRATVVSEDIYIIINNKSQHNDLTAHMTATSTSADGVNEGQLHISASESPIAFDDIEHELDIDKT
ncbi:MAG: ATP-binding protein [Acidimicrobiia bacterium]|nr:ATP-binding protein [Acidimicrobiia bacterium]MCY4435339.1 putative DNA binding domain-containing protein [bacterium]